MYPEQITCIRVETGVEGGGGALLHVIAKSKFRGRGERMGERGGGDLKACHAIHPTAV